MFRTTQHCEVFYPVVKFVSVYVMHDLIGSQ